jgi:hypothetical protein
MDLKEILNAKIKACDVCGATYTNIKENIKCTRTLCHGGTVKSIPLLLLPSVTMLNTGGLNVIDSYITVHSPSWVEIVINFKDDYGNHFKGSPMGFEFNPAPNPMKHSADTPIELKKRIEISGKSDLGILQEIQCSVNDLYAWVNICCKSLL